MLQDDDAANLPDLLAMRLLQPLPGEASQLAFQPQLSHGRHFHPAPPWGDAVRGLKGRLGGPRGSQWCAPRV